MLILGHQHSEGDLGSLRIPLHEEFPTRPPIQKGTELGAPDDEYNKSLLREGRSRTVA